MHKSFKENQQGEIAKKESVNEFREHDFLLSISLSTTTSTTPSDSTIQDDDEKSFSNLLDTLLVISDESDSEEISEELPEDPALLSLTKDVSYFESLMNIPDIDRLSDDISVVSEKPLKKAAANFDDIGYFVDPLTGLEIQYRKSKPQVERVPTAAEVTPIFLESNQSEESEILLPDHMHEEELTDELLLPTGIDDIRKEESEDLLAQMLQLHSVETHDANYKIEADAEELYKQQEAEQLRLQTLNFINDLVQKVVEKCELVTHETILRRSLDKRKLLLELFNFYQKLEQERRVSKYLNRKVVTFYKRQNFLGPILEEKPKTLPHEKAKYIKATKRLDELLIRKRNMEDLTSNTTTRLKDELSVAEQQAQNEILMFEGAVKRTLCREDRPYLNRLIEKNLKNMAQTRKEVSDMRYRFILKQNTHAQLLDRISKIEHLTNNITIGSYNHMYTENQILDKQIEERSRDIEKLRLHFYENMHSFAHIKQRQETMKIEISKQYSNISALLDKRNSIRTYLHQLDAEHRRIRQEINKLNIQSGLLNKPALLHDYDRTVEYIIKQRDVVNDLKATLHTTQQRIIKLEKRLTRDKHGSTVV